MQMGKTFVAFINIILIFFFKQSYSFRGPETLFTTAIISFSQ